MKNQSSLTINRAEELFREQREAVYRETDRLFSRLLLLEWVVLIIVASLVVPENGQGHPGQVDLHVWRTVILGGAITLLPVALTRFRPGAAATRYTIAAAQMLHSGLLISLVGGRLETHFHVFCSLMILSFYRDWRLLVPATLVVALDHFLRGVYWPLTLFGTLSVSPWRSLEHVVWVIFGDICLGISCLRSTQEMRATANRTAALETSQHSNQLIMDNSRDVICANDYRGRFVTVSAACEALWGYKPEELIGKTCADLVHPDDRERSRLANLEIMAGHPVTNFENRYLRKDGTVVDVLWSAYWSEHDGTMFQVARDITQRKRAEAALEKSNRQLASAHQANQLIMDNSQDVICSFDAQGRFLSVNAACQRLWGYEAEELIGRVYLALVHPEDRARSRQMEEGARTGRRVFDFVNRCLRKDGTEVDVLWSTSWSASDEILFCVAHDVTEQKRVERALREAKEAADRANRAKSEFLSRMSHELRTPLNAILGFGQLLERQNPRTTQAAHLHHILTAGRHLLKLIDEVLDISRIESDRMHLSLEPVSVKIALKEAVELIRPLATEHAVNLFAPTEPETDHFVFADHQRLKQVLLNILNNGVKYTPEGGTVVITCKVSGQKVRLNIHDTGVGIAAEKLSRLFTPFDRLGAEQLGIEGTGLGLALSRRLIEAMHGEIGVQSNPGRGTTFWLELERTESPLKTIERKTVLRPELPIGTECTILYIEDNLSNLSLIEQMLSEDPGIHLMTAMQGRIGLDLARQHSPDLILLDLQLPDMPGSDVLAELQSESVTRDIPVVVLTADATAGQLRCLLSAGARDYITKPIDVSRFYRLIEEIANEEKRPVLA
ncbi:MAG TPA: PAS domain S-box protein [Chthoniobacterales bacterium]|jgi:PAS domain S-box-containing protein